MICASVRLMYDRWRNLTSHICITAFFFVIGHLSAQEDVSHIRIDVDYALELSFSADGSYLLIGTSDHARRYDLERRRFDLQLAFASPYWATNELAINSDGTRLVRIDYTKSEVHVIDFDSGDVLYAFPTPRKQHRSNDDTPDLTLAGDDDRLIKWKTIDQLSVAEIPSGAWTTLPSADFLAVSDSSCLTVVGDLYNVWAFHCESDPVHRRFHRLQGLSLSGDGSKLLLRELNSDYEAVLHILDSMTLTALGEAWAMPNDTYFVDNAWLGDEPIVLYESSGIAPPTLTVFNVGERIAILSLGGGEPGFDPVLSADGRWLARRHEQVVEVYPLGGASDARSGVAMVPRLVPQLWHSGVWPSRSVSGLSLSKDGRILGIAGEDGWVSLWDADSGRSFRRVRRESASLALSQDGTRMITTELYGDSGLWDVESGELLRHLPSYLFGYGDTFAAFLADDTRSLLCQWQDKCTFRDLSDDYYSSERFDDGTVWSVPSEGVSVQLFKDGNRDYNAMPLTPEEGTLSDYFYHAVSLAPDEAAVALALGARGVGWMELSANGRQRIIQLPGIGEVTAVAALDDVRVVAGLSNGNAHLVDAVKGETLHTLRTGGEISAVIRLDDSRLAIVSRGDREAEILIVSQRELSVLERLATEASAYHPVGFFLGRPPVDQLAVSADGRWLASVLQLGREDWGREARAEIWDTDAARRTATLDSRVLPTVRVEFDSDSDWLLVDSREVASLWNLNSGSIMQQFHHKDGDSLPPFRRHATLIDDAVIYISDGVSELDGLKSWSTRSGLRDIIVPDAMFGDGFGMMDGIVDVDGSRAVLADSDSLVLFYVDERDRQAVRIEHDRFTFVENIALYAAADLVLLNLGGFDVEALNASSGVSIWRRDGILYLPKGETLLLTADQHGLVDYPGVVIANGDDRLLVLDVMDGNTRFSLDSEDGSASAPVIGDDVVHGVLRLRDDYQIERLSLQDGSVIGSTNLGISSLGFAVSDQDGEIYVVADGHGQAVMWDTISGERTIFESTAVGAESVAFSPSSPDGRLMLAIAETDGTVGLWDVSKGPADLRHLAKLIAFEDGGWAVVGADGRYDASDPADLDGLNWVLPDAPTKPVPLSVFYRDYYEPGLLPRLLAGEEFPPIESISNRDRVQPQVQITDVEHAGDGHVNVTVEVRRSGAKGVDDLKLFRDGRLVELKEDLEQSAESSLDTWRVTFPDIALPTSDVEVVEFSAYAFNADGVKSDTVRESHVLPGVKPQPRRAYVVVVGVNAYENQSWDLDYAAEDARVTGEMISRYMRESEVFDEVHTVSLIAERKDKAGPVRGTAARADLLAVLDVLAGQAVAAERLGDIPCELWSVKAGSDGPSPVSCAKSLSEARPDDLVYLSFSGHGLSGKDGLFHLFLSDIGAGDQRVVNEELLDRTLDSDELADYLRRVDAGDFVMVIDACSAAASVEGGGFKPGPMGSRGLGQLAYDKAMRVLAASQAEEVALESSELRHGLLTYAMLREGLAGGAADRAPEDRWINLTEMLNYGVERVPLLYEDIRDGSFAAQGKGLTPYEPSCGNEQDGDASDCREQSVASVQRPSLFDFSRGQRDVSMPVSRSGR